MNTSSETSHVSYDKENALYVGGNTIWKIKINFMVKGWKWKLDDDLLVVLNSFVEDEDNTTESQDQKIQQAKKSGLLQSTVVAWLDVLSFTYSWEH